MKYIKAILGVAAIVLATSVTTNAVTITLAEHAVNVDGTVTSNPYPTWSGLGSKTITLTSPGAHFVGLFVDHEIDQAINTFFNEYGVPVNTPSLIQTWEVDEPGYLFGDIYDNFTASDETGSALDNSSGVPSTNPDDVSMAIGWNFVLNPGQTAHVSFLLSDSAPLAGFYLEQIDPDSPAAIYFSSSVRVVGGTVPDGGATLSMLFLSTAILGLIARRQRSP